MVSTFVQEGMPQLIGHTVADSRDQAADNQEIKYLLENPVLIHKIIDTLAGGLLKELDGQLDRLFGICGATLYCVLKAHIMGKLKDVSVNLQTFNDIYKEIMDFINKIHCKSEDLSAQFDAVQQEIIDQVKHEQQISNALYLGSCGDEHVAFFKTLILAPNLPLMLNIC